MIFAFDMDGTILDSNSKLLPETIEVLKLAKEKGHILVIATGRPLRDALEDTTEFVFDYYVLNNGTYVYDSKNKKIIYDKFLPKDAIYKLIEFAKEKENTFLAIHADGDAFRTPINFSNKTWNDDEFIEFKKFQNELLDFKEISKIIKNKNIAQASLRSTKKIVDEINSKFPKDEYDIDVHIANDVYLDINPKGVCKYSGIEFIKKIMNIDMNVVAFGDSGNDIQMLEKSYMSFCMSNGNNIAKNSAQKIIGSNDTPAIANELKKLI